jgi:hypothetical protein
MSLDLPQLVPQLNAAGQSAAEQAAEVAARLPTAVQALSETASLSPKDVTDRLRRAGDRWPGALPTDENPKDVFPAPPAPERYRVVGADGSQIYPDRHAGGLFYLINIGSICLDYGSGQAPAVSSQPALFHELSDLYDEHGALVGTEWINGQRDLAELGELARLAKSADGQPTLALLDNGLLLWMLLQVRDHSRRQIDRILHQYLGHLTRLRESGAALAGVIDQPRHANVLALAQLGTLPLESIDPDALQAHPYLGLTDRALFRSLLSVGDRSAIFIHGSPVNRDFQGAGHEVRFFYLRSADDTMLRVEVPIWVAEDPELLTLVHSGLLADSATSAGFPYSLVRAHELAVVSQAERAEFQAMLAAEMIRHGMSAQPSTKSITKRWSGGRRHHRV